MRLPSHAAGTGGQAVEGGLPGIGSPYQRVFDTFPDGSALVGPDGRITATNRAEAEMYRYGSPEHLIGVDPSLLVAPSGRDHAVLGIQRRLRGESVPAAEFELRRKDGTTFYGETTASSLLGPTGGPSGYICTTRDITERKRSEKALRESEGRYRDLFHGAPVGIFQTSLAGVLMTANRALAQMLGFRSAADMVSTVDNSARQVWADPDGRARFTELLDKRGVVRGYECLFVRTDGRKIWVSLNSRVVAGTNEAPSFYAGFVEDITERKLAADALRSSQARLQLTLEGAVTALAATTEFRDPYTSGHQTRRS